MTRVLLIIALLVAACGDNLAAAPDGGAPVDAAPDACSLPPPATDPTACEIVNHHQPDAGANP